MDKNLSYTFRVVGIALLVALILFFSVYLFRDSCEKCFGREINRINPEDIVIQNMGATEQPLPTYEEVTRPASGLTTRQLQRHDKLTSDHINNEKVDTDTQLDGDSTGESTTGDDDNDNESSGTRNIANDSGITINLMKVVKVSKRKEKSNKSDVADDSGIKSESCNDTFDKDDDIKSNYNTASGSSAGGGASSAPSPWINF